MSGEESDALEMSGKDYSDLSEDEGTNEIVNKYMN